jgi:xanthine dehydrogenase accessory factor
METFKIIAAMKKRPFPVVLALVVGVTGSAPRHLGAAMAIWPDGSSLGSVGGGEVETATLEAARRCFKDRKSTKIRASMLGQNSHEVEPICGGEVEILVQHLDSLGAYEVADRILSQGRIAVLVFDLEDRDDGSPGLSAVVDSEALDGLDYEALAQAARGEAVLSSRDNRLYIGVGPPEKLLILGGGYVGRALAEAAIPLGFAVTVADFRGEFADPKRYSPDVSVIHAAFEKAIRDFPFDPWTYAVVVSPGHVQDLECVRAILRKPYKYAGFIGSKRKAQLVRSVLAEEGFPHEAIASLHAPIGMEIGAETPEEIAISILAQLVAVRRKVN